MVLYLYQVFAIETVGTYWVIMSKLLNNTNKSPLLCWCTSRSTSIIASSVTPKRASSTSAICWFDKAHLSVGLDAGERRHESGCGRLVGSVCRSGGQRQAWQSRRRTCCGTCNGRERGAGAPGTASAHRHRHVSRTHPQRPHDARARGASLRLIAAIFKRAQCTPPATRYEFHLRSLLPRWSSTTDRTDPFIICEASGVHQMTACTKVVLITSWTGDNHARQ